jgi:hypothetical protein
MGKVIVKIKLSNQADLVLKDLKLLKGKPRSLEAEALVDTGATRLYLKPQASGYYYHSRNWLQLANDFSRVREFAISSSRGACSNTLTLKICRI